jgi:uncharacterized protein YacL (UPF0231 family)
MSFNEIEIFPEFKSNPALLEQGEACEVMVVVLLHVFEGEVVQEDLYYDADSLIQCGWAD